MATTIQQRFGRRLRDLRTAQGLSQNDLSLASGLDRVFLGSLERGEHSPSLDTLVALSRGLGVKLPKLVDLESGLPRSELSAEEQLAKRLAALLKGTGKADLARVETLIRIFLRKRPG